MNARQFWEGFSFDYSINEQDLFSNLIAIEGHKQAALNLMLPPGMAGAARPPESGEGSARNHCD